MIADQSMRSPPANRWTGARQRWRRRRRLRWRWRGWRRGRRCPRNRHPRPPDNGGQEGKPAHPFDLRRPCPLQQERLAANEQLVERARHPDPERGARARWERERATAEREGAPRGRRAQAHLVRGDDRRRTAATGRADADQKDSQVALLVHGYQAVEDDERGNAVGRASTGATATGAATATRAATTAGPGPPTRSRR